MYLYNSNYREINEEQLLSNRNFGYIIKGKVLIYAKLCHNMCSYYLTPGHLLPSGNGLASIEGKRILMILHLEIILLHQHYIYISIIKSDNQSPCRLIPAPRKLSSGLASGSQTVVLLKR